MKDYYQILGVNKSNTIEEIKKSYQDHISRFNGLPFLTNKMILEVKDLKTAYYVLGNPENKNKYDNRNKVNKTLFQMNDMNEDFSENTKINDRLFGNIFNNK